MLFRKFADLLEVAVAESPADIAALSRADHEYAGRWIPNTDAMSDIVCDLRVQEIVELEKKLTAISLGTGQSLNCGLPSPIQIIWPTAADLANVNYGVGGSAINIDIVRRRVSYALAQLLVNPIGRKIVLGAMDVPKSTTLLHPTYTADYDYFKNTWADGNWRKCSVESDTLFSKTIPDPNIQSKVPMNRPATSDDLPADDISNEDLLSGKVGKQKTFPNIMFTYLLGDSFPSSGGYHKLSQIPLQPNGWTPDLTGATPVPRERVKYISRGKEVHVQWDARLVDGNFVTMPLAKAADLLKKDLPAKILASAQRSSPDRTTGVAEIPGYQPVPLHVMLAHELIHVRRLALAVDDPRPLRPNHPGYAAADKDRQIALKAILQSEFATETLEEALVTYGHKRVCDTVANSSASHLRSGAAGLEVPSLGLEYCEADLVRLVKGYDLRGYSLGFWRAVPDSRVFNPPSG